MSIDQLVMFNIGITFQEQINIIIESPLSSSLKYLIFVLENNIVSYEEFDDIYLTIIEKLSSYEYKYKIEFVCLLSLYLEKSLHLFN